MENNIGLIIRSLREDANLTRKDLADKAQVSKSLIEKWETGLRYPSRASLDILCHVFNVDLNYLLGLSPIKVSYRQKNIIQIPLFDCDVLDNNFRKEDVMEMLVLPNFMLDPEGDYFAICLRDNSMCSLESRLKKGDIVVFEKIKYLKSRTIGLFMVDHKVHCRLYINDHKHIKLISTCSDYDSYVDLDHIILGRFALVISNRQDEFIVDYNRK